MKKIMFMIPLLVMLVGCTTDNSQVEDLKTKTTQKDSVVTETNSEENGSKSADETKKVKDKLDSFKKKQSVHKGSYTFYSDTKKQAFTVDLTDEWFAYPNPEELLEGVNASLHRKELGYSAISIMEASDFVDFDSFNELSRDMFDVPEDAEKQEIKLDNMTGTRYVFTENVSGMKMKYAIYMVQCEDYFIEMQLWSFVSKFDDILETGEKVLLSLKKEP